MTQASKFQDWGFLILRLSVAVMLATFHGWGKFTGATAYIFGGQEWGFPKFVGSIGFPLPTFFAVSAAFAEFLGCLLLALGLFTRYAAGLVAITMSVAVFYHLRTDLGFELAGLYLVSSLFFVFAGPGRYSLDHLWSSKSGEKRTASRSSASQITGGLNEASGLRR
jgi:putative oxidoreductase